MTQKSLDIPSLCVSVSLSVCCLFFPSFLHLSFALSPPVYQPVQVYSFIFLASFSSFLSSFLAFTAAEPSVVLFGEASFPGFGLSSNKRASLVMGSKNFPILVVLGKTHMQTKSETHTHTQRSVHAHKVHTLHTLWAHKRPVSHTCCTLHAFFSVKLRLNPNLRLVFLCVSLLYLIWSCLSDRAATSTSPGCKHIEYTHAVCPF